MALYVLTCLDKPDSADLRAATREAHLAFIANNRAMVKIAGPFLNESGGPVGSLLILEAESLIEVETFAATDPYAVAGLFASAEIRPWRITVGAFA
ncbi:MAG: YciI family protein [Caulobacteraceae bacterium]|nr:YciI family protein [Caulobacteraceae bacterium]